MNPIVVISLCIAIPALIANILFDIAEYRRSGLSVRFIAWVTMTLVGLAFMVAGAYVGTLAP